MPAPTPFPAIRAERCVLFCLSCGRSTTTPTYVVEGLFGWIPYGRVTAKLHCRSGCGDRLGIVLPIDAPTPRQFADRYDLTPQPTVTKNHPAGPDIEADCRDWLIEVGEGGTFLRVHAKSADPAIVWWDFDYMVKKLSDRWGNAPHLIVARGAQWTRDSKRDFRVVGGKLVERIEGDPDEGEDGIG